MFYLSIHWRGSFDPCLFYWSICWRGLLRSPPFCISFYFYLCYPLRHTFPTFEREKYAKAPSFSAYAVRVRSCKPVSTGNLKEGKSFNEFQHCAPSLTQKQFFWYYGVLRYALWKNCFCYPGPTRIYEFRRRSAPAHRQQQGNNRFSGACAIKKRTYCGMVPLVTMLRRRLRKMVLVRQCPRSGLNTARANGARVKEGIFGDFFCSNEKKVTHRG